MAGIHVVAAIDMWDLAERTYRDNFPATRFYNKPCESASPEAIAEEIGSVDLLLASPECTSHTCAKGASPRSEKSRSTAFEVIRFAEVLKPRWIVVENVVHMRSWRRFQTWLDAFKDLGYQTKVQVLNASDFGVPQTRRRMFVTADLDGAPPEISRISTARLSVAEFLESENGYEFSPLYQRGRARPTLTRARRALRALGKRKPFLIVYYGSDGAGGWQRIDRPLRTVTTVDRFAFVRPKERGHELRMLQVPELTRAMGFPEDHRFDHGTRRDKIKLIGNAVCPPVMKAVVEALTHRR